MKKFKELLKDVLNNFGMKTCWRCGKKFYHGFMDVCPKCDKEIHRGSGNNLVMV